MIVALIALIGISRILLGVHYLSDVVGAWAEFQPADEAPPGTTVVDLTEALRASVEAAKKTAGRKRGGRRGKAKQTAGRAEPARKARSRKPAAKKAPAGKKTGARRRVA